MAFGHGWLAGVKRDKRKENKIFQGNSIGLQKKEEMVISKQESLVQVVAVYILNHLPVQGIIFDVERLPAIILPLDPKDG
jgi:hypothetical protein